MWVGTVNHISMWQTTPNLVTHRDSVGQELEKVTKSMILFCSMMSEVSAGKAQSWGWLDGSGLINSKTSSLTCPPPKLALLNGARVYGLSMWLGLACLQRACHSTVGLFLWCLEAPNMSVQTSKAEAEYPFFR